MRRLPLHPFIALTILSGFAAWSPLGAEQPPAGEEVVLPDEQPETDHANEDTENLTPMGKVLALLDGEPERGRWLGLTLTPVSDKDEELTHFSWEQMEGPKTEAAIEEPGKPRLWVMLWKKGSYVFLLKAKNKAGEDVSAPIRFEVPDGKPVLTYFQALSVAGAGEKIDLPGDGWKQICGPKVQLHSDQDGKAVAFRLLKGGVYLFEALGDIEAPERRGIVVPFGKDKGMGDRRPFARLPVSVHGVVDETLVVDGSLSWDPDKPKEGLEAIWSGDLDPSGLELVEKNGLKLTVRAKRKGVYRIRLSVSDGSLESDPIETFVRIREVGEALESEADESAYELPDPLARTGSVLLYEANLERAIQQFSSRCHMTLQVAMHVGRPETYRDRPLHLGMTNARIRTIADWICRQVDLRYKMGSDETLWLVDAGGWWIAEKPIPFVLSVDALYADDDAGDLLVLLKDVFRGVLKNCPGTSISMDLKNQWVRAIMPQQAGERLKHIIAFLRAPSMGIPPTPGLTDEQLRLRGRLATVKVSANWKHRRLDLLLRDLSLQSGFTVGYDPRQFKDGLPEITWSCEDAPLRQVARDIVELAGFDGCQPGAGDSLWFYKGGEPYPTQELLWDLSYVVAYEIGPLLKQLPLLSGEIIAHHIRRRIYPASWMDPAAVCVFHEPTAKLLVIHAPMAHDGVVAFLNDLASRGMGALGPEMEQRGDPGP